MSELFVFICARETYPLSVPQFAISEADYRRKVSNAFSAISGGFRRVGDLVLRPNANAFDDHLLCDGSTIQRTSFPQLVTYLAGSATAESATLPDYRGAALTVADAADTPEQTISDGGTVSTGGTVTTPTGPSQSGGTTGGNVSTGGRYPRLRDENFE